MAARRMGFAVFALVVMSSIWLEKCSVQSQAPLYQNLTIITIQFASNVPTDITRGRVELQVITGQWGTICPLGWSESVTSSNVNTTCAMLGFRYGGRRVPATFGDGNKNFLIENATCPVNATSWYQCTQYFAKKCGPQDEELAVECYPDPKGVNYLNLAPVSALPGTGGKPQVQPPINITYLNGITTANCSPSLKTRLFGGDLINASVGNGFVQVFVNGQWGFVCPDFWNQVAAKVVCRELCYTVEGFDPLPGIIAQSVPEPTNKVFLLNGFRCTGSESSLLNCTVVNPAAACRSNTALAGVQCAPECCSGKPVIAPDVTCSSDVLVANFSKFPLITVNNIFMVNNVPPQCMNLTSSAAGVVANLSVASICGAELSENSTHITYTIPIRYLWLSGTVVVNSYTNMRYDLVCSVAKAYSVINRIQPYTLAPNITIYQQYNYTLSLDLYTNCNFTSLSTPMGTVFMMEVGQWLSAAVTVKNYDNRTKLVITDCDAFPVIPYAAYTPVIKLIQDKCPVDTTLTMYSLDNRRQGFQLRVFIFPGYSMVYLRCSVNVCLLDSTSPECDRACNKPTSGRRKRAADSYRTGSVDTGTILIYDTNDAGMAKIFEAIGQKSQQSDNAPDTTTTADILTSSTMKQTAGPQTARPGEQGLTGTYTPSSTTLKLDQLLKEWPDRSDKQAPPSPNAEVTTATSASPSTTTSTTASTTTRTTPSTTTSTTTSSTSSTTLSTTTSTTPSTTARTSSSTTARTSSSTTTRTSPPTATPTTNNNQRDAQASVNSAQTTISPESHPKMISTAQEKATSATLKPAEAIKSATPTKAPENKQVPETKQQSGQAQQPGGDKVQEELSNSKGNQTAKIGQAGVASELQGSDPNGAIVRHLNSVTSTIVLLYTLVSMLL